MISDQREFSAINIGSEMSYSKNYLPKAPFELSYNLIQRFEEPVTQKILKCLVLSGPDSKFPLRRSLTHRLSPEMVWKNLDIEVLVRSRSYFKVLQKLPAQILSI